MTPVVVTATPVRAWLAQGHEIVAVIAADQLTPSTKSHVAQILGVPAQLPGWRPVTLGADKP